jgi:hypothetical protein
MRKPGRSRGASGCARSDSVFPPAHLILSTSPLTMKHPGRIGSHVAALAEGLVYLSNGQRCASECVHRERHFYPRRVSLAGPVCGTGHQSIGSRRTLVAAANSTAEKLSFGGLQHEPCTSLCNFAISDRCACGTSGAYRRPCTARVSRTKAGLR